MAVSEVGPQRGWKNLDIDQFVHFLKRFALPDHSSTVHYHARDYPKRCSTGLSVNFKASTAVVLDAFRTKRLGSAESQWINKG